MHNSRKSNGWAGFAVSRALGLPVFGFVFVDTDCSACVRRLEPGSADVWPLEGCGAYEGRPSTVHDWKRESTNT
jgi:hypothetical protein